MKILVTGAIGFLEYVTDELLVHDFHCSLGQKGIDLLRIKQASALLMLWFALALSTAWDLGLSSGECKGTKCPDLCRE